MCYYSMDGVSHLGLFICEECGFEFPYSQESDIESVCVNCEKEVLDLKVHDFMEDRYSIKEKRKQVSSTSKRLKFNSLNVDVDLPF